MYKFGYYILDQIAPDILKALYNRYTRKRLNFENVNERNYGSDTYGGVVGLYRFKCFVLSLGP